MWCIEDYLEDHPNVSNFNNASVALMMMMMLMLSGHEGERRKGDTKSSAAFHKLHDIM